MLRSYLAVIRDSFRAAMNSRVLYIVLALIVVVLVALAPLHVRQTLDWKLSLESDFPAPERLVKRLVDEGQSGRRAAVAHVWNRLSPELQEELEKAALREPDEDRGPAPPQGQRVHHQLLNEFNDLLREGTLYDEQAFQGKRLTDEARQLVDKGSSRTAIETRRLNRLLLSTALRRDVDPPGATQLDFYYFNWHWSAFTTSVSHATFASGITNQLPVFFDKFVMSIGIFIAILVTASIIPEMLEPGSLNLLLSKPVHRWGLLIAKYLGGCVFILLCSTLFFAGVYLWLGIQLGIWERAILLSIPVYVLVFAMYYSVSVLAGIWFRSPILSITFAILFWAVCFVIGYGYNLLDYRHYNTSPRQMVAVDDDIVMVDLLQRNLVWDESGGTWKRISARSDSPQDQGFEIATWFDRLDEFPDLPGPAADFENDRLLVVDNPLTDALANASLKLVSANPDAQWKTASRGPLPPATVQIFYSSRFGPLALNKSGSVYRWTGSEDEQPPTDEEKETDAGPAGRLSGLLSRVAGKTEYEQISAEEFADVRAPSFASFNPDNDEVAIYSAGKLVVLAPDAQDQDQYGKRAEQPVGDHQNHRMTALVSYRGSNIFVMLGNGRFYHLDAGNLQVLNKTRIGDRAAVRNLSASPTGKFAAVALRSGQLWIYDADRQAESPVSGVPRTDVMATTFDDQDRLWIGTRFQEARLYDPGSGDLVKSNAPAAGMMTRAFRYIIRPLYRIFPKPGEFYKLISHLSSSGNTKSNPDVDLTDLPHRDNPWSPLRSGLTFTVLMLAISCLVFQRQDF